jgi:peptide/nickel transport system permease protein
MQVVIPHTAEGTSMVDGSLRDDTSVLEPGPERAAPRRGATSRLVAGRLIWLVITLWAISALTFIATQALPGDPALAIIGRSGDGARLEAMRQELGLDRPLLEQYFSWLGGVLTGDFGQSTASSTPVSELLGQRILNSFVLVGLGALIAVPLSVLIALTAAARPGGIVDRVMDGASLVVTALPEFVVGIALITVFATSVFTWLPAVSIVNGGASVLSDPQVLILPAVTLAILVMPYLLRLTRASAGEIYESEYVRAARLRGVSGRRLLWRHVLPNAAPPTLQATVLVLVYLLGGVVIVEAVFNFPGIGLSLVDGVRVRDLPVIQALALLIAAFYLILTTVADLLTIALTPRLRKAGR